MYLDTDVILAVLKEDNWLQSNVDLEKMENPETSAITITEMQLVYEDWNNRFNDINQKIRDLGIKILEISPQTIKESSKLQKKYGKLNVFDSIHLAHAKQQETPIISIDTLYPKIKEVENKDPRNMG